MDLIRVWILEGLTRGKADFTLLGEGRGTLKLFTGSEMVDGMIKTVDEVLEVYYDKQSDDKWTSL